MIDINTTVAPCGFQKYSNAETNPDRGASIHQQHLGVCLDAGITVPQTLAVLGSDDDALLCEELAKKLGFSKRTLELKAKKIPGRAG